MSIFSLIQLFINAGIDIDAKVLNIARDKTQKASLEINYQETKIGDMIVNKNNNSIYEATIADADDLNWIVIK